MKIVSRTVIHKVADTPPRIAGHLLAAITHQERSMAEPRHPKPPEVAAPSPEEIAERYTGRFHGFYRRQAPDLGR